MQTEAKPGWKSSEFWLTVILIAAAVLLVMADKVTVHQAVELWPVVAAYAMARGFAKLGNRPSRP